MSSYTGSAIGENTVLQAFAGEGIGEHSVLQASTGSANGHHRLANDALALYELYRGVDAAADLAAAPWETFASLPHDTAALDASHTYHFVLRKRNEHDLVSENVEETCIEVDAGGDEVAVRPSDPDDVSAEASAGGKVRVLAHYLYSLDEQPATVWLIYSTTNGDDPDVDVDTPETETMVSVNGVAALDWETDAQGNGTTVKAIVRTRRIDTGPVNIDSTGTTVYSAVADTSGPSAPGVAVCVDSDSEQVQ